MLLPHHGTRVADCEHLTQSVTAKKNVPELRFTKVRMESSRLQPAEKGLDNRFYRTLKKIPYRGTSGQITRIQLPAMAASG
jgi:hypothetical protein